MQRRIRAAVVLAAAIAAVGFGSCGLPSAWGLPATRVACGGSGLWRIVQAQWTPPRVARRATTSPREITRLISKSPSAPAILSVLEQEMGAAHFNYVHVSAALHRLALRQRTITSKVRRSPVLAEYVGCAKDMLAAGAMEARQTANMIWAVANLQKALPETLGLLPSLIELAIFEAGEMNIQHLSNSFWAIAKLRSAAPEMKRLVPVLAEKIIDKADDAIPQHLSNMMWAVATMQGEVPEALQLVPVLVEMISDNFYDANNQDLSNVLWSIAKLHSKQPEALQLVPALIETFIDKADDAAPQAISNIFWAIATTHGKVPEVLALVPALVEVSPEKVGGMIAQHVANTLWSLSVLQPKQGADMQALLSELQAAMLSKLDEFKPFEIAQSTWGLASLDARDEALMEATAQQVVALMPRMSARSFSLDLPQIICSFAMLGFHHQEFMAAVESRLTHKVRRLNDWNLCALLWSYRQLDDAGRHSQFTSSLQQETLRRGIPAAKVDRATLGPAEWSHWEA